MRAGDPRTLDRFIWTDIRRRHCEERSDEAIQSSVPPFAPWLPAPRVVPFNGPACCTEDWIASLRSQ
jgi:hypothetical protein